MKITFNKSTLCLVSLSATLLTACAPQYTPSMMNTHRAELVRQTAIEQIPLSEIDDVTLTLLADDYRRYGNGPVDLAMVYDPTSKTYTAMKARNQLREIESGLKQRGVHSIQTRTVSVEKGQAALMVSYESIQVQAPTDCHTMPGLEDYRTERDIAAYRFGCSTETMLARQIARPSDLMGRGADNTPSDGRRATNVIEEYRNYGASDANRALEQAGQGDIGE